MTHSGHGYAARSTKKLAPEQSKLRMTSGAALFAAALFAFTFPALGQTTEPIPLANIEDLQKIGADDAYPVNGNYYLSQDIDASPTSTWNDGKGFQPIKTFSGTLDGQGHSILNLFIHRPDTLNVGIFSVMKGEAKVLNLNLVDGSITGLNYVGAITGINNGSITQCRSSVRVIGVFYVGGLVGWHNSYIIERSNTCGTVIGLAGAGGIAGMVMMASLVDCYSTGPTSGLFAIGGLCGGTSGVLTRCYAAGPVESWMKDQGGLVGLFVAIIDPESLSLNSFWDIQTTGCDSSPLGQGKNASEMHDKATYSSSTWDMETVWQIEDGKTYPYLLNTDPNPADTAYSLECQTEGEGTILGTDESISQHPAHSQITLTAQPAQGKRFMGWKCDGLSAVALRRNPLHLVINRNWNLTAVFAPEIIEIATIQDLQKIGNDPAYPLQASYQLINDIDASETSAWNNGNGFEPIGCPFIPGILLPAIDEWMTFPFCGEFDGKGHTISGLFINRPDHDPAGLFSIISGSAFIHDLTLTNASVIGGSDVGTLAGINAGRLENISINADITSTEKYCTFIKSLPALVNSILHSNDFDEGYAGGVATLAGHNLNGIITHCDAYGTVKGYDNIVGGLVGKNDKGTISDSWAQTSLSSGEYIGGFAGFNTGNIERCFAGGSCDSGEYVGGLVGVNEGSVKNSFATAFIYAPSNIAGGLLGKNAGPVENCYASGNITCSPLSASGLVGVTDTNSHISNAFWDQQALFEKNLPPNKGLGQDLPTDLMLTANTFVSVGWDFNTCWEIREGQTYPTLRGIGPNPESTSFTITTSVSGDGQILRLPDAEQYRLFTVVRLQPQGFNDLSFAYWQFDALPPIGRPSQPLVLVMDRNWNVQAKFIPATIEISTFADLQRIGREPLWPANWTYTLNADLDASDSQNWNNGRGFLPIASYLEPFTGTLDGQGHSIDGLFINQSSSFVGLFAAIAPEGLVENLVIVNADIRAGYYAGIIAGINMGAIFNCQIAGTLSATQFAGAAAGSNTGEINRCAVQADITASKNNAGGITGENNGIVQYACANGAIQAASYVGGLIGQNTEQVSDSSAQGTVFGGSQLGGLIGANDTDASVERCFATASINAPSANHVGGLIGSNVGRVADTFAAGSVVGSFCVGGLIGYHKSINLLSTSYAVGRVQGDGTPGGLVGYIDSAYQVDHTNSFWEETLTGQSESYAGSPLSAAKMSRAINFTNAGWDFENVWTIREKESFPYLRSLAGGFCPQIPAEICRYETIEDPHSADQNRDGQISLTELLRVIQFFNLRAYYCVTPPAASEDGYLPGSGTNQSCTPHQSDYTPQDWKISLTELLRLIQFFNLRGYHPCPGTGTEDNYCPGI